MMIVVNIHTLLSLSCLQMIKKVLGFLFACVFLAGCCALQQENARDHLNLERKLKLVRNPILKLLIFYIRYCTLKKEREKARKLDWIHSHYITLHYIQTLNTSTRSTRLTRLPDTNTRHSLFNSYSIKLHSHIQILHIYYKSIYNGITPPNIETPLQSQTHLRPRNHLHLHNHHRRPLHKRTR